MPDADGRFIGQGWSRAREDAWTRLFGIALADDPAYETQQRSDVPAEPPDETDFA